MAKVVHFEIPAANPETIMKFFNSTFGWNFMQFGTEPYWLTAAGEEKEMGIGGAIMERRDPKQPMVNSIAVSSIDDIAPIIEQNGGKIVVQKMAIPGMGYLAYFTDPEGNIHGLWQMDENAH